MTIAILKFCAVSVPTAATLDSASRWSGKLTLPGIQGKRSALQQPQCPVGDDGREGADMELRNSVQFASWQQPHSAAILK